MRTANNTNSNYTVENLVAKYRNYVNEHCPKTVDGSEWQDKNGEWHFEEIYTPIHDAADEQLLITIYTRIKGSDADERVLSSLKEFADEFYRDALTEDEIAFLCNHFSEVVSYEFSDRKWLGTFSNYPRPIPERLKFVKEMVKPVRGSSIYVADSGIGDIASLYRECFVYGYSGFSGNGEYNNVAWALGQIRLCFTGIESHIEPWSDREVDGILSLPHNGTMDIVVYGAMQDSEFEDFEALYDLLKPTGKMLLFLRDNEVLGRTLHYDFFKQIISEGSIAEIVSIVEDWKDWWGFDRDAIWLVVDKSNNGDVRIVDKNASVITISSNQLKADILWPSYYLTKRPQTGIPLSDLVYSSNRLDDKKELKELFHGKYEYEIHNGTERIALPEKILKMPIPTSSDLSSEYKDANLCAKQLNTVSDPKFDEFRGQIRLIKKQCVLVVGNQANEKKMALGYVTTVPKGGMARYEGWACLYPKEGFDVRYVAAILLMPSVRNQILSICDKVGNWNLPLILDYIIVPNHTDKERLSFLAETNYDALLSSQETLKQEAEYYKKSIRLRKHALSQSFSAMKAMFSVLNDCRKNHNGVLSDKDKISPFDEKTVQDAFDFLADRFESMGFRLDHIADIDYSFSTPEWIDPEKFIENYVEKNKQGWINFKSQYSWEKGQNLAKEDLKDPSTRKVLIKRGESLHSFYFSHDALERVMNNIISNAQAHGFTDKNRNDYILRFSWHLEDTSLIIEIENNGTPIPSDRNTSSLLEYGVSTALNKDGHNGIGCNEIDNIMHKYDGNVKIVSSPNEVYTVKYVLTFERTNSIDTYNL